MSTAYVSDSKRFYKNILSKVFLILSFEYVPSNNVVWKQFKYLSQCYRWNEYFCWVCSIKNIVGKQFWYLCFYITDLMSACSRGSRDIQDSKIYTLWWNKLEKCSSSYCKEKLLSLWKQNVQVNLKEKCGKSVSKFSSYLSFSQWLQTKVSCDI